MTAVDWDALALCLDGMQWLWVVESDDVLSSDREWWTVSMVAAPDLWWSV